MHPPTLPGSRGLAHLERTGAAGRARAFLHDALADKITLDGLARHAALDKFHLVRAFRSEVGRPPCEYLTHLLTSDEVAPIAGQG